MMNYVRELARIKARCEARNAELAKVGGMDRVRVRKARMDRIAAGKPSPLQLGVMENKAHRTIINCKSSVVLRSKRELEMIDKLTYKIQGGEHSSRSREEDPGRYIHKLQEKYNFAKRQAPKTIFKGDRGVVYYVKLLYKGKLYWKLGYTGNSIVNRFKRPLRNRSGLVMEVLESFESSREVAYGLEMGLHRKLGKFRPAKTPELIGGGDSEIVTIDILRYISGLDYRIE